MTTTAIPQARDLGGPRHRKFGEHSVVSASRSASDSRCDGFPAWVRLDPEIMGGCAALRWGREICGQLLRRRRSSPLSDTLMYGSLTT